MHQRLGACIHFGVADKEQWPTTHTLVIWKFRSLMSACSAAIVSVCSRCLTMMVSKAQCSWRPSEICLKPFSWLRNHTDREMRCGLLLWPEFTAIPSWRCLPGWSFLTSLWGQGLVGCEWWTPLWHMLNFQRNWASETVEQMIWHDYMTGLEVPFF